MLEIKNLHVEVDGKEILKGVNLKLEEGKVHALMGPNGSGKSTLANVIMGNPKHKITKGQILLNGEVINDLSPDEKAKNGLFLSFQYPSEISGVTISNFLRTALNNLRKEKINVMDFQKLLKEKLKLLNMKEDFASRYLNAGFSGGEKKKSEILQLAILNPKVAILDETDSGTDVDALKTLASYINVFADKDKTLLIITHYNRILQYLEVDQVFIMYDGKIVKSGEKGLANEIESEGYAKYIPNSKLQIK